MKKLLLIIISGITLILVGCSTTQPSLPITKKPVPVFKLTKKQIDDAKPEQFPKNYHSIIKEQLINNLKDPDSAKLIFYKPIKAYSPSTGKVFMMLRVDVNAKNSYGAYTGYKSHIFMAGGKEKLMDLTLILQHIEYVATEKMVKE